MNLNEVIRDRRKELGLTQQELAARVVVARQTVVAWEKGDVIPELANIGALEEVLQLTKGSLFLASQGVGNPTSSPRLASQERCGDSSEA